MKKKTIDLYEVSDLKLPGNEKLLQKVLSKHIEYFVTDDWYSFTKDELFDYLNLIGFENIDIRFSGFYSQGDGANFTGVLQREHLKPYPRVGHISKLREACDTFYEYLKDIPKGYTLDIYKIKSAPYCFYTHENTTEIDLKDDDYGNSFYGFNLKGLEESYKQLCKIYHRQLEDDYFTLTSDEYILEMFEEENAVFTELGNLTYLD